MSVEVRLPSRICDGTGTGRENDKVAKGTNARKRLEISSNK